MFGHFANQFLLMIVQVYSERFSVDSLKKFVEDVIGDKLEPYLKSEEPPETQGDVKVRLHTFTKVHLSRLRD